jgi:hypothetical protein
MATSVESSLGFAEESGRVKDEKNVKMESQVTCCVRVRVSE